MLHKLEQQGRGPELILSRSSLNFVRKLFEMEVAEIADGTVSLAAMAREPGYRTKVCVKSTDAKVDPVGACVGARGSRVKSIVREINGEKISSAQQVSCSEENSKEDNSKCVYHTFLWNTLEGTIRSHNFISTFQEPEEKLEKCVVVVEVEVEKNPKKNDPNFDFDVKLNNK